MCYCQKHLQSPILWPPHYQPIHSLNSRRWSRPAMAWMCKINENQKPLCQSRKTSKSGTGIKKTTTTRQIVCMCDVKLICIGTSKHWPKPILLPGCNHVLPSNCLRDWPIVGHPSFIFFLPFNRILATSEKQARRNVLNQKPAHH